MVEEVKSGKPKTVIELESVGDMVRNAVLSVGEVHIGLCRKQQLCAVEFAIESSTKTTRGFR